MPPQKKRDNAPPVSSADRIGALPDSILHHLLSFLPAQEAVRTCVLARQWRHLWRSSTGLRIDDYEFSDFQNLRKFVDHLVFLRERTDLDTFEIKLDEPSDDEDEDVQPYVNLWIRFAVMCKVRVLKIDINTSRCLDDLPLVSRHLRTLDLTAAGLRGTFPDFANCPALEDLKMHLCIINAGRISSRSLKHLSISGCRCDFYRICVSTPALLSLKLDGFEGKTPFLENMELLETAYVDLDQDCEDVCYNYKSGVPCGANNNACEYCVPIKEDSSSDCLLLGGISSVKHLKLLSESRMFIFRRDLRHCPIFSKLKTLLLNEYWCEAPDLDPLARILKIAPVLEKLTLQLFSKGPNHKIEMKGRYISTARSSAISEHLNIVEVKCNVVDEKIFKVLKFMCSFDIRFSFE